MGCGDGGFVWGWKGRNVGEGVGMKRWDEGMGMGVEEWGWKDGDEGMRIQKEGWGWRDKNEGIGLGKEMEGRAE